MAEDVTKMLKVTFRTGLPIGTRAHFKHEGERWIAYPVEKNRRILAVIDRLLGIYALINDDLLRSINDYPENAGRVVMTLEKVAVARKAYSDMIIEKCRAEVM